MTRQSALRMAMKVNPERAQIDVEILIPFVLLAIAGLLIFALFIVAETFWQFILISVIVIGLLVALREWLRPHR